MNKFKDFFVKLKSIKHVEIYLALFVGVIICIGYFSFFTNKSSDKEDEVSTADYSTAVEYVEYLENKLSNVLSRVSGVGEVRVIITLQSGFTYEYATDTETKTTISGSTETTVKVDNVLIVSNKPVIIKEIYPVIKGVVIVAEGSENITVKMNILAAVETVLEVETSDITILS